MRKISVLFILFLSLQFFSFSQDSLTIPGIQKKIAGSKYPPVIIRCEEFSRFPTNNFLEAMTGLFPWVFLNNTEPNEFLFIVNGNLIADVNSISLYDIEEATFVRNLDGTLYPFSRAGIFYIKTKSSKQGKPVINFNTHYNVVWNTEKKILHPGGSNILSTQKLEEKNNYKPGHFQSNHLSLSKATDKLQLYSSVQIDNLKNTGLNHWMKYSTYYEDTLTGSENSLQLNAKFFLNLVYKFTDKLEAGINGNYVYERFKEKGLYDNNNTSNWVSETKNPLHHSYGSAFIKWTPVKNLHNTFSFEYIDDKFDHRKTTVQTTDYPLGTIRHYNKYDSISPYMKQYLVRNDLKYTLPRSGKLSTEAGITFSFLKQDIFYRKSQKQFTDQQYSSYSWNMFRAPDYKITNLIPRLSFSYDDAIHLNAGYAFILNKDAKKFSTRSKNNIYAGANFNLKKMIGIKKFLNRLDLSLNYSNLIQNGSNLYWIDKASQAEDFGLRVLQNGYGNNGKFEFLKNELISVQLNAEIDSKLLMGIEWSKLTSDILSFVTISPLPGGPGYFVYYPNKSFTQGLSFYSIYRVIKHSGNQWDIGLNLVFPDTKYEFKDRPADKINVFYKTMIGLNNNIHINQFFAQLNCLIGFERQVYDYTYSTFPYQPTVSGKSTDFLCRYLIIGYDIKLPSKYFIQKLSVFAHARNLVASEDQREFYQNDSYAGIGINFTFQ